MSKTCMVQAANPGGRGKAVPVPLPSLSAIDVKRLNIAISRVMAMMREAGIRIETLEIHQLDIEEAP
jgi:hypothetical protein